MGGATTTVIFERQTGPAVKRSKREIMGVKSDPGRKLPKGEFRAVGWRYLVPKYLFALTEAERSERALDKIAEQVEIVAQLIYEGKMECGPKQSCET